MVFNPTLTSDIGFEQPVAQTSSVSAVSSIIEGLGLFDRAQAPTMTADEKFQRSIEQFRAMEGVPQDINSWTPAQRRVYVNMNPQFANKFESVLTTTGDVTFANQQAEVKAVAEWTASPNGMYTRGLAETRYPNDPASQQAFIQQEYAQWIASETEHARLKRESEAGNFRGNLSQQAWDASSVILQNTVGLATDTMVGVYEAVRMGQEVTLGQVSPDLAAAVPGLANVKITQDNFAAIAGQVKSIILRTETNRLVGMYGNNVQQPSQEYQNNLFAMFDDVTQSIAQGVDPKTIRDNQEARAETRFQTLTEQHGIDTTIRLSKALGNNVQAQTAIYEMLNKMTSADGVSVFERMLTNGDTNFTDASRQGAQDAATGGIDVLDRAGRGEDVPQETITNTLNGLPAALDRANVAIDSTVYRTVLNRTLLQDHSEEVFNFVQADLTRELDRLSQMSPTDGRFNVDSIFFDGEKFVFQQAGGITTTGGQEDLQRINDKIAVLRGSGQQGQALIGALTQDWLQTEEQSSAIAAPANTVELAPFAYGNASMRPIVSMEGASTMTRPEAETRMAGVLEGPFKLLQERLGRPLVINDAIAKAGTSRENNTPGSRHFHGDALDISTTGMSNEEQIALVQAAMEVGFQGFGFGNGILHIDLGDRRAWHYGNSTFGGMAVDELIGMVRNGTTPRPELAANTNLPDNVVRLINEATRGDTTEVGVEFDPGQGKPEGLVLFDQQTQMDQPVDNQSAIPTQDQTQEDQAKLTESVKPEVRQEIENLIAGLTNQGVDRKAIIDYLLSTGEPNVVGPR